MKNNEKTKERLLDKLQKLRTRVAGLEASNAELQQAEKTLLAHLDISEFKRIERKLRESEERYRIIFEHAPIGIELAAQNGRPLYVNQALQLMLGYSEEVLRAMRFPDYTHPDDRESSLDLVHALLDGKSDHLETERRYVRKDDTVIWGHTAVSSIRKPGGNLQLSPWLRTLPSRNELKQR